MTLIRLRLINLIGCALISFGVAAGPAENDKIDEAIQVMNEIMAIPEQSVPPSLLANAYGIAIVPSVVKVGFVVGGRFGQGVLVVRDRETGRWGAPSFITLAGGSVGFQIGAQSTDVILIFKNRRGIDGIVTGKFTLGADAAVAAGPVGRKAEAATDAHLKAGILSYSRSRGLFAGVSLEGSVLDIDNDANSAYYEQPGITAADILYNQPTNIPRDADRLIGTVQKYAY
jgi:lipid-binding SYLF domain-containing protein